MIDFVLDIDISTCIPNDTCTYHISPYYMVGVLMQFFNLKKLCDSKLHKRTAPILIFHDWRIWREKAKLDSACCLITLVNWILLIKLKIYVTSDLFLTVFFYCQLIILFLLWESWNNIYSKKIRSPIVNVKWYEK